MNKREQIREILSKPGHHNRADVARTVGCSYQYVRNEEVMMEHESLLDFLNENVQGPTPVTEFTLHLPKRSVGLWEDIPIRLI